MSARWPWPVLTSILVAIVGGGVSGAAPASPPPPLDAAALKREAARLAPVDLTADIQKLPPGEKVALRHLIEAARIMDGLFLRQVWSGNPSMLVELAEDATPLGRLRLQTFLQNKGPWLRLDHERPFLPGVGPKPEAGTFYPADATKAEIETWMKGLSPDQRTAAGGFFTTIRRTADRKLEIVPYSREYQVELGRAAALLREAAAATAQPTLKTFLEGRAAAFLSNDYYASDLAWMKLDATIEPTIGPYEVYEDGWFNAKAAFEAFITIRDEAETAKVAKFSAQLQEIENNLPIAAALRNPKVGALAPIRVVNSIFATGDANRGVQTAAFNLPNDERMVKAMGSKRTMLKNVQEAKFARVLVPISKVALSPADQKLVSFEAFFTHILMHELVHGLGPHEATVGGKKMTVRAALEQSYSAIEEAKADVAGLFALQHLVDRGVIDRALERTMYTTFLASMFRSIRFGLHEAHGKGIALQLSSFLDAGAVKVAPGGTFSVDAAKVRGAVAALAGELMTVQASGDKARAAELLRTRAVIRPEVQRVLDRLKQVPVDISPRYLTAQRLLVEQRALAPTR